MENKIKIEHKDVGWKVSVYNGGKLIKVVYIGEYATQGVIYKDYKAYETGKGVCYIPEFDFDNPDNPFELSDKAMVAHHIEDNNFQASNGYHRSDFLRIADGNKDWADCLFEMVDWQHPETLADELEPDDFE